MMKANKKQLHYGALISIIVPENEGMYLYSDGFVKENIRAESFKSGQSDFLASLFLVTPKYETKKQRQLNKLNIQDDFSKINQKNFDLLVRELESNYLMFSKNKGKPISYGEEFQLLHFRSRKYLSFNQDNQSSEFQNNYTLKLSELSSEKTQFKIGAAFKHQQDSSKVVKFDDLVHLSCCPDREAFVYYMKKKDTYSRNKSIAVNASITVNASIDMTQSQDLIKSQNNISCSEGSSFIQDQFEDSKYQFYVGYDKKCYFNELEYGTTLINYGDIFSISSYENGTHLQCLETLKKGENQKYFRTIREMTQLISYKKGEVDELNFNFKTMEDQNNAILFFQDPNNSDFDTSLSMWKIEAKEIHIGGCIYEGDQFRLKNMKNNMYLMVKQKEDFPKQPQDKKDKLDHKKQKDYHEQMKKNDLPKFILYLTSQVSNQSNSSTKSDSQKIAGSSQNQIKEFQIESMDQSNYQYAQSKMQDYIHEDLDDFTEDDTLFVLEKIDSEEQQGGEGNNNISPLKYEQFFRIKHFRTKSYLNEYIKVEKESKDSNGSEQLLIQKYFAVEMKEKVQKREVFKFYKTQYQEIWETTLLLSCIPIIKKRTKDLNNYYNNAQEKSAQSKN